jgi:hypothetical protein
VEPAGGVAGWVWVAEGGGEQPLYFVDAQRDQAGIAGRRLVWPGGRRRLGADAVPEPGGGDGADGQGSHVVDEEPGEES